MKKVLQSFQVIHIVAFFSTVIKPMKASIGIATTNKPANANPISIIGRSSRQKKNFDIPQQALMPKIIILKNTYIIAIVKSMNIAPTSLFCSLYLYITALLFVGIIICPSQFWINSFIIGINHSNLLYRVILSIFLLYPVISRGKFPDHDMLRSSG